MPDKFATHGALKEALSAARQDCMSQTRREIRGGCLYYRQAELVAVNAKGDKVTEAGVWLMPKNGKELRAALASMKAQLPETDEIYIEGGLDYADSPRDRADGAYDPWVGEWGVLIWTKE